MKHDYGILPRAGLHESLTPLQADTLRLWNFYRKTRIVAERQGRKQLDVSKMLDAICHRLRVLTQDEAVEKARRLGLI